MKKFRWRSEDGVTADLEIIAQDEDTQTSMSKKDGALYITARNAAVTYRNFKETSTFQFFAEEITFSETDDMVAIRVNGKWIHDRINEVEKSRILEDLSGESTAESVKPKKTSQNGLNRIESGLFGGGP